MHGAGVAYFGHDCKVTYFPRKNNTFRDNCNAAERDFVSFMVR